MIEQLWREHSREPHAFLARRVGTSQDADDLLQEVFLAQNERCARSDRVTWFPAQAVNM
jgi:DNA-directed RNA polymerase specialized sigma24 family protein